MRPWGWGWGGGTRAGPGGAELTQHQQEPGDKMAVGWKQRAGGKEGSFTPCYLPGAPLCSDPISELHREQGSQGQGHHVQACVMRQAPCFQPRALAHCLI